MIATRLFTTASKSVPGSARPVGGGPPSPHQVPDTPTAKINTTDPDARLMKMTGGYLPGI